MFSIGKQTWQNKRSTGMGQKGISRPTNANEDENNMIRETGACFGIAMVTKKPPCPGRPTTASAFPLSRLASVVAAKAFQVASLEETRPFPGASPPSIACNSIKKVAWVKRLPTLISYA